MIFVSWCKAQLVISLFFARIKQRHLYFDGEEFVTFNLLEVAKDEEKIVVAVTNRGKISMVEYPLLQDEKGYYFEYGATLARINLEDFEEEPRNE